MLTLGISHLQTRSLAVALALLTAYDELLRDVERTILKPATHHDANPLSLLHTVPGIGKRLRLVRRYDIHRIERSPRGQDVVSYGRLVTCAKESNGNRVGTSGATIGQAHLPWAFSDAAVLC